MNKIKSLFDEEFVRDLFKRELLPRYPGLKAIGRVEIKPYKRLIWETTYHVVIGFKVHGQLKNGGEMIFPVVCSAHSEEDRINVYDALSYLWAQGFPDDNFDLPKSLFHSEYFRGVFYQALEGENLLYYIRKSDQAEVKKIVRSAAKMFARLHALPAGLEVNFNPTNARIATVVPGTAMIFKEMNKRYQGKYDDDLIKIYNYLIAAEERFFKSGEPLVLIHGDAHAENIIRTSATKIGLIDFTDCCLGDFARDLGTFLQQLEYKIRAETSCRFLAVRMKRVFLKNYLAASGRKSSADLRRRIKLYYNWTALRTATFLFLKFEPEEKLAQELLEQVKRNLYF